MSNPVNRKPRSQIETDEAFTPSLCATAVEPEPNGEQLIRRILHRIESRLPGRVRQLAVHASENAIVLSGFCSTYYTKQVAQHAAMGALEYERLINNIDVQPPN